VTALLVDALLRALVVLLVAWLAFVAALGIYGLDLLLRWLLS